MARSISHLAIVTGAASGLGRAFCRRLAAIGGWHLVAADIDDAGARDAVAELACSGNCTAEAARLDVADPDAWIALRDRLRDSLPRLDLLINNAGICLAAEIGDGPLDPWRRVTEINYLGMLYGCHAMTPWLKQSAGGTRRNGTSDASMRADWPRPAVINVASAAAFLSAPSMAAYSASKAAVASFSESMHAELLPCGVHVTVILPGFFRTRLLVNGVFCSDRHRAQAEKLSRAASFGADDVARASLNAARRGQLYVVMGGRARFLWRWKRVAPASVVRAMSRAYRRTFAQSTEPQSTIECLPPGGHNSMLEGPPST